MLNVQPLLPAHRTLSGRVVASVLGTVTALYLICPVARTGLEMSAPVLLAMLPAALAGLLYRLGLDGLEEGHGHLSRQGVWAMLGGALGALVAAAALAGHGWHLVETAQPVGSTAEGVLALLLPLAALGAAVLVGRAGYLDGIDPTGRASARSGVRGQQPNLSRRIR
ncbi:hypothetical protein V3W47_09495 [Deinococcus sp. YIM 134068]|uniref:hypothetical protein n=1 Tax=Deinococcus lichenicola TaxID=3118910 RepID=UPI002F9303BD